MKNIDDFFEDARKQEAIISEEETLSLLSEASGTNFSNKKVKGNIMSVLISAASVAVASFILFNISSDDNLETLENLENNNNNKNSKVVVNEKVVGSGNSYSNSSGILVAGNDIEENVGGDKKNDKVELKMQIDGDDGVGRIVTDRKVEDVEEELKNIEMIRGRTNSKLKRVDSEMKKARIELEKAERELKKANDEYKKVKVDYKLKVEGIKLIELNEIGLKNLGLREDSNNYEFTAFGDTKMPILVTLKKDRYTTNVNGGLDDEVKEVDVHSIHPVFVTDKLGNKKISLFQSKENGTSIMLSKSRKLLSLLNEDDDKNKMVMESVVIDIDKDSDVSIDNNINEIVFDYVDVDEVDTGYVEDNEIRKFSFSSNSVKEILFKDKEDLEVKMKENGLSKEDIVRYSEEYTKSNGNIRIKNDDGNGKVEVLLFKNLADKDLVRNEEIVLESVDEDMIHDKLTKLLNEEQVNKLLSKVKSSKFKLEDNMKKIRMDSKNFDTVDNVIYNVELNDENSNSEMKNKKVQFESKMIFQKMDSSNDSKRPIVFENPFAEMDEFEKINQLLPIAVRLDKTSDAEIDYILWYEPTEEFVRNLPLKLQDELAPEIAALRNGEKAICGEAPIENAHTDSWRACNGAIENLSVYPNPAVENANISFDLKEDRNISIALNDLSGKEIKKVFLNKNFGKGSNKSGLNLSGIPAGMYYISLTSGQGEQAVQRIIVE